MDYPKNQVTLDPEDSSVGYIGDFTLINLHSWRHCAGRTCVIHAPSDHHLRDWPLWFRADNGLMERVCAHGIGHPDPDALAYRALITNDDGWAVHGCDGCCHKLSTAPLVPRYRAPSGA